MTNPVGTKEQRDRWRLLLHHRTDVPFTSALDGLDIAEEMAADLELHDPNSPALAKWHEWQDWRGTRGGER